MCLSEFCSGSISKLSKTFLSVLEDNISFNVGDTLSEFKIIPSEVLALSEILLINILC